jgi:hypothetical protein
VLGEVDFRGSVDLSFCADFEFLPWVLAFLSFSWLFFAILLSFAAFLTCCWFLQFSFF